MSRRYAIIFVCQGGNSGLAAKACLLAASLHRFARMDRELIAAVPGPASLWPAPAPIALDFLRALGVRIVAVENQLDLNYPIANKIGCLSVPTVAEKLILLDSDMLLMRPWEDEARFGIAFNARPAAAPSFTNRQDDWDAVYAACKTRPLRGHMRTIYTDELIAPYFNSGFVAVPAQVRFGDVWLDCCRRIDAAGGIPNKRPYLDQIALSPAVSRLGMEWDNLPDSFNYPINLKTIDASHPPLICHYHDTLTLMREPAAVEVVKSLAAEFGQLRQILNADANWRPVLQMPASANSPRQLLITGIPRSGTSYLCNLLHRFNNCVVLNEPEEIGPALEYPKLPWPVATFFRDRRRDILQGVPIKNKLIDGQVVEDTTTANQQVSYTPRPANADFVLGVKSTIPFLSRLPLLRQVMPDARFVACIRNPLDTIASWKTSFPHLREADVNTTRIGNAHDPFLSDAQRQDLSRIAAIPDLPERRAAWWTYLAELVRDNSSDLIVVRYEELAANPREMIRQAAGHWDIGNPAGEEIAPSAARSKRDCLDDRDLRAIEHVCAKVSAQLGYACS